MRFIMTSSIRVNQVIHLIVPHYPEFSLEAALTKFANDAQVMNHLPDPGSQSKPLNRDFFLHHYLLSQDRTNEINRGSRNRAKTSPDVNAKCWSCTEFDGRLQGSFVERSLPEQ